MRSLAKTLAVVGAHVTRSLVVLTLILLGGWIVWRAVG